jgi:hypothetical protein
LHGQPGPHQLDPGLAKYKVFHDLPARQVCMLSNQAEGQYDARRAACFPGSGPGSLNIDNYFSNFAVKRLKQFCSQPPANASSQYPESILISLRLLFYVISVCIM